MDDGKWLKIARTHDAEELWACRVKQKNRPVHLNMALCLRGRNNIIITVSARPDG